MLLFKITIFYLSFLVFPFLILLIFRLKNINKFVKIIWIIISLLFIDARFIEPNIILIKNTSINIWLNNLDKKIKIALISDIHLGIYKKQNFLEKAVKKINKIENLDYIFIAWDITYFDKSDTSENINLDILFKPFEKINKPVYWVLWNHDVELPWPNIRENLVNTFNKFWLNHLNNNTVKLDWFTLVWLWSFLNNEDNTSILNRFSKEDKVIVLTHNPDTISKYTNKIDLTLAWHTHWWQIKIPFLYKYVIPTRWDFDEWLTREINTQLFITSWLWVVWLPMRFLNPPVIDVLEIE